MRRDLLLLSEMIDAAERARALVGELTVEQLQDDRLRREALLWNFPVLGEASTSVSSETKRRFPDVRRRNQCSCETAWFMVTGPSTLPSCTRRRQISCTRSSNS
jgi:hypothetical protein